jgi:hypothetical protein
MVFSGEYVIASAASEILYLPIKIIKPDADEFRRNTSRDPARNALRSCFRIMSFVVNRLPECQKSFCFFARQYNE